MKIMMSLNDDDDDDCVGSAVIESSSPGVSVLLVYNQIIQSST